MGDTYTWTRSRSSSCVVALEHFLIARIRRVYHTHVLHACVCASIQIDCVSRYRARPGFRMNSIGVTRENGRERESGERQESCQRLGEVPLGGSIDRNPIRRPRCWHITNVTVTCPAQPKTLASVFRTSSHTGYRGHGKKRVNQLRFASARFYLSDCVYYFFSCFSFFRLFFHYFFPCQPVQSLKSSLNPRFDIAITLRKSYGSCLSCVCPNRSTSYITSNIT